MVEKRRYERVAWFCPVEVKVLPKGPVVPGNTFDISVGGVGLASDAMVERGKPVMVRFHIRDHIHEEPIEEEVMGRIAYARADEDGNRIGIEFLEVINESSQPVLAEKLDHLWAAAC